MLQSEDKRYICDVLHDLVPFVQLKKKHEKHLWWSVPFSKVIGF